MFVAAVMLGVVAVNTVDVDKISDVPLGTDVMVPVNVDGVVPNPLTVMLSPRARECAPVNAIVTLNPDTEVPVPVIRGFRFAVEYSYVPVPVDVPAAVELNTVNCVVEDAMIWKVPLYPAAVRPAIVT